MKTSFGIKDKMERKTLGIILQVIGVMIVIGAMGLTYFPTYLYYQNEFLRNNEVFLIIKEWSWIFTIIFIIVGISIALIGGKLSRKSKDQMIEPSSYQFVDKVVKERILDTAPIARPKLLMMHGNTYILCFTNKRLILYYFDSWSWHFQNSMWMGHFEKKMIRKQEELKTYGVNIEELISSHEKNFSIPYADIEKVSFFSIFFIRLKMFQNYTPRTITFDFIVNNRKYVKSLFRKYLPSVSPS